MMIQSRNTALQHQDTGPSCPTEATQSRASQEEAGLGGGRRGASSLPCPWGALLLSAEDTPPHSPARFQSLMTFVNHQPACPHQQTLPADTPFNTKAVAMPFKRGSLKAPLCRREEKQHTPHTHMHKSTPSAPQPPKSSDPLENTTMKRFQLSLSETSGQLTKQKKNREGKPEALKKL